MIISFKLEHTFLGLKISQFTSYARYFCRKIHMIQVKDL